MNSEEPQFTPEQLAQLEAEMDRITIDDVLMQTVVSLLNLTVRKAGLAGPPGTQPEPDLEQLRQGIEAVRALAGLLEQRHGDQLGGVRDTLSQLQMFYVQASGGGAPGAAAPGEAAPDGPAQPSPSSPQAAPPAADPGQGSAQKSGRLWIPGQ